MSRMTGVVGAAFGWGRWLVLAGLVAGGTACSSAEETPAPEPELPYCGDIHIESQAALDAVSARHCRFADSVVIQADDIETLEGLEDLEDISVELHIQGERLRSIEALRATMRYLERVTILDAPRLATLAGLEGLESADLVFIQNTGIQSLRGLRRLSFGSLQVTKNRALSSLQGLGWSFEGNSIAVHDSPLLESLVALVEFESFQNLSLRGLGVRSLTGLEKLRSVEGRLSITRNPELLSTDGLAQLERVGQLDIIDNAGLHSLEGLEAVREVSELRIRDNSSLSTLGELLEWPRGTVTTEVSLSGNVALPQCEVDAFYAWHAPQRACENCSGNAWVTCG